MRYEEIYVIFQDSVYSRSAVPGGSMGRYSYTVCMGRYGRSHVSGILQNNECYVVVNSRADENLKTKANHIVYGSSSGDNVVNFNGNDAVGLYHNGMLIDVIGEINNSADWGKDISLIRSTTSISPNTQFTWDEWSKLSKNDFTRIDNHKATLNQQSNLISTHYSNCNSIIINDLTPNSVFYVDIKAGELVSTNVAKIITYKAPISTSVSNLIDFTYYTNNNVLYISNIANLSTIRLYTITGTKVYETITNGDVSIPVSESNIYILQIINNNIIQTIKLFIQ